MRQAAQVEQLSKTVLVVDDEPQILSIVSEYLRDQYHIITADSGREALQKAEEFNDEIHVLLSDFQMVGMTGIELATRMTVARPRIKVLLMSSYSEGMLVLKEEWHFLRKPFILSQLRSLIGALVYPDSTLVARLQSNQKEEVARGAK